MNEKSIAMGETSPRRGVIIAFLIAGFVLVGVSFFANRVQRTPAARAPRVTLLDTASRNVGTANVIRFLSVPAMQFGPQGWAAGEMHLHLLVDSVMTMPMGSEITQAGDTFSLHLAALSAGMHHVRLFWANAGHLPLGDTTTIKLNVTH